MTEIVETPVDSSPDDVIRARRVTNTVLGVAVGSIFHPLQVTKVLIQLGHEPMALRKGRAWHFFGPEKRYLPNGFAYAGFIYKKYGLSTIYSGVAASITGNIVGSVTTLLANEHLSLKYGLSDAAANISPGDPYADSKKFVRRLARESLAKTAGIVVARPFQVVMIRMIAQHVGGEEVYRGVFSSLSRIYKEEGLPGLFSGVVPQIACELCIFWTVSSLSYVLDYMWKTYFDRDDKNDDIDEDERTEHLPPENLKRMIGFTLPFVINSIYYPLQLTSTLMAVNGSGLVAGSPPFVPIYRTWQDCLHDLSAKDQLKRGAKIFFRFYEKPITYRYGEIYAVPNAAL